MSPSDHHDPGNWRGAENVSGLQAKTTATHLPMVDRLALSTARIECWDAVGTGSVGTGFFFTFVVREKDAVPVLVTNKHLIGNARSGRFRMHGADAAGNITAANGTWIAFQNFEDGWIHHFDPDVDLCVFPVAKLIKSAAVGGLNPAVAHITASAIPTDEEAAQMSTIEQVLMVGYPNGIWDDHNALPIMRCGTTATHVGKDFHARKEFLIDVCTIPGSSGSPVFAYPVGRGEEPSAAKVKLLGIARATFVQTVTGEISAEPIPTVAAVHTPIPINLGIVIRANRLLEMTDEIKRRSEPVQQSDEPDQMLESGK